MSNEKNKSTQPIHCRSSDGKRPAFRSLGIPIPVGLDALQAKQISDQTKPMEYRDFVLRHLKDQRDPMLSEDNLWNIDIHRQRLAILMNWEPLNRWQQTTKGYHPRVLTMVKDLHDIIITMEDSSWLLLKSPEDPSCPELVVDKALADGHAMAAKMPPRMGNFTIGIGVWHPEQSGTSHSVAEAIYAAAAAPWLEPEAQVHGFQQNTIERMLGLMPYSQITEGHIAAVERLAERRDWDQTVRAYFTSDRDVGRTADRLGLHPNSVTYRLRETAGTIGLDPLDYRQGSELHSALILYDLQRASEKCAAYLNVSRLS